MQGLQDHWEGFKLQFELDALPYNTEDCPGIFHGPINYDCEQILIV